MRILSILAIIGCFVFVAGCEKKSDTPAAPDATMPSQDDANSAAGKAMDAAEKTAEDAAEHQDDLQKAIEGG